ncbi:hypothetical protein YASMINEVIRUS_153 [Yasminevirus sp. GU-2018]|uniref:Uncharacterized protein n=1 Tax=Yasminevirus sp. GU-2018 TaxID=2420051 RepID=A0A5K0U7B1_9VIRU|nr:hypothetical protein YASMINEVIRUS_153 [Yasminevirus sp. GU-2018]
MTTRYHLTTVVRRPYLNDPCFHVMSLVNGNADIESFRGLVHRRIGGMFNQLQLNNNSNEIVNLCRQLIVAPVGVGAYSVKRLMTINIIITFILNHYKNDFECGSNLLDKIGENISYEKFYNLVVERHNLMSYDLSSRHLKGLVSRIIESTVTDDNVNSTLNTRREKLERVMSKLCSKFGIQMDRVFNNDLPVDRRILVDQSDSIFDVLELPAKLTVLDCCSALQVVLCDNTHQRSIDLYRSLYAVARRYNSCKCARYLSVYIQNNFTSGDRNTDLTNNTLIDNQADNQANNQATNQTNNQVENQNSNQTTNQNNQNASSSRTLVAETVNGEVRINIPTELYNVTDTDADREAFEEFQDFIDLSLVCIALRIYYRSDNFLDSQMLCNIL